MNIHFTSYLWGSLGTRVLTHPHITFWWLPTPKPTKIPWIFFGNIAGFQVRDPSMTPMADLPFAVNRGFGTVLRIITS